MVPFILIVFDRFDVCVRPTHRPDWPIDWPLIGQASIP